MSRTVAAPQFGCISKSYRLRFNTSFNVTSPSPSKRFIDRTDIVESHILISPLNSSMFSSFPTFRRS